ncbi:HEAT repeat domain-containing protein [Flavobacteriaceae bacterium 3-367]|uniref:hypothetical protein n=1 Tax=Eudoraea algarum TaxID=3417568 RepID=UPI00328EC0BD
MENFEIQAITYLSGELQGKERLAFEKFLEDHPQFQEQFQELSYTWNQMDQITTPEPSKGMDNRFYKMLSQEREKNARKSGLQAMLASFTSMLRPVMRPQLAYGMLLLVLGLGLGYYLNPGKTQETDGAQVVQSAETEEVREKLVLTLLEQPSANQRLQGVSEANKFGKVDEKIIEALLQTLNNDPNVNVRLAAVEALTQYVDNPVVREGLVQSIVQQESAIMQVTLANLMVALQEKKSIEPFKKLIRTKEVDGKVKQKLKSSIESII